MYPLLFCRAFKCKFDLISSPIIEPKHIVGFIENIKLIPTYKFCNNREINRSNTDFIEFVKFEGSSKSRLQLEAVSSLSSIFSRLLQLWVCSICLEHQNHIKTIFVPHFLLSLMIKSLIIYAYCFQLLLLQRKWLHRLEFLVHTQTCNSSFHPPPSAFFSLYKDSISQNFDDSLRGESNLFHIVDRSYLVWCCKFMLH